MKRLFCGLALSALVAGAADAAVIGSLAFRDPAATVNATDTIDLWVTLTLDQASDSLSYDPYSGYPNGLNPLDIPATGRPITGGPSSSFASYSYISQFTTRFCGGTFIVPCSGTGSQYTVSSPSSDPDHWFNWAGTLNPGESLDILLYRLAPADGTADPGLYTLYQVGLGFRVVGRNSSYQEIQADVHRFNTPSCSNSICAFTRTVTAIPVPGAVWLFGGALAGLGLLRRRRCA